MASKFLPPLSRELTKNGDRVLVRSAYHGGRRVSSTVKLTAAERRYVEWLRGKPSS
jgi:hypothetical protein